jgi:hypothetical protein
VLKLEKIQSKKMARFLSGLNEEIAGFVEIFPYHSLQDLVDQDKRTERKIQHEARGKSYSRHSIAAPWRKQQSCTSFGGGRSHGAATRPSSSNATSKMVVSSASCPTNQQRPATSTIAPSANLAATSSARSREIECHKCHGRGHIAAQCPSRRTMIFNERGEWEYESDPEDEGPRFDEEIESEERERERERKFSPTKETIIVSFLVECLVLLLPKKIIISGTIFFTPEA